MTQTHIVERAYALAKSGRFQTSSELSSALRSEGYTVTDFMHLNGRSISNDLARQRKKAWAARTGVGAPQA
jgi:hypothetical protein